jgi:hypothetical protein
LYRSDIKEAVRIFRPVLQSLKIRSEANHPVVFFTQFDELSHLQLDECSVQVLVADIDTSGMFAIKYTKQGLLRAYIILNCSLYNDSETAIKELRKMAGVHEFVHFIAVVYVATITGPTALRSQLLERLQHTIRKLPESNLLTLYTTLTNKVKVGKTPVELTDFHFRLGYEGATPDYELLFLHFMFSRELFETYFDKERQTQFKKLITEGNNSKATELLAGVLTEAAKDKDVPVAIALNQLLDWMYVYTR